MAFDYKKFLTENKLTTTSRLIKEEEEEMDDTPEAEDDWYKTDDDSSDDEQEPTAKDVKAGDAAIKGMGSKEAKLAALIKQKDEILGKFKTGQITIAQYKEQIGNIPQQIKNLQASLEQDLSVGDEEEM